jgi:hypothetical protein
MAKTLFPMCASFGPMFMALAHGFPHREGFSYGLLMAVPGALMVSAALSIRFRELVTREKVSDRIVG